MDQERLKQFALELEDAARRYAAMDPEVRSFAGSVEGVSADAKAGRILTPLEHIPGDYYFSEGTLRKYRDLEHAYSKFQIEVTGGEPPALIAFRNRVNAQKN
ncbi:hypothetical protein FBZ87_103103 [Nitrospirillum amazonense]|uniref:Uncharacterized protein n=1 Tax=Nitrospirillum amazonense TaxID=28077 RepID=A0A560K1Y8_9PROT|nr:hypothetical protein [Nitrospirillum amazonense]TWB77287.1 hypothetical protein FBZ87_103103 [Nitrospirillum amazonense]